MNKLMEFISRQDRGCNKRSGQDSFSRTLRWLASERGMGTFMNQARILLKDFSGWVNGLTAQVCETVVNRGRKIWVSRCGI
ncbi:hypothetical protein [Candidatus Kuenenia stuttgartiensis]|uniref:hypothetical protein n=1 Tax=Kuenenia stuttgartiensis TaxID=174633 RepID=UPI00146DC9CD|nr:hypothetical protein [Candidatus Kuenenia stuttgartiensis]